MSKDGMNYLAKLLHTANQERQPIPLRWQIRLCGLTILVAYVTFWWSALNAVAFACLLLMHGVLILLGLSIADGVTRDGLLAYLPGFMREMMLETRLVDWLMDTSFTDAMRPYVLFLLGLSPEERDLALASLPPTTRANLTRPGLLGLLPVPAQTILMPRDAPGIPVQGATVVQEPPAAVGSASSLERPPQGQQQPQQQPEPRAVHEPLLDPNGDLFGQILMRRVMRYRQTLLESPVVPWAAAGVGGLALLRLGLSPTVRHQVGRWVRSPVVTAGVAVAGIATAGAVATRRIGGRDTIERAIQTLRRQWNSQHSVVLCLFIMWLVRTRMAKFGRAVPK